ncbi:MAG: N-acetylneuraminate synthase family protein [Verrucomicrobiae bacterium]|nr:N-acetylneuraminate synthase family protein [Verrucomicrobiae bacterium]
MKTNIIAEAGVNHGGSLAVAKELAKAARAAGADAVKIQTFRSDRVVSRDAPKAAYQLKSTDPAESQLAMLRKLEFPESDYPELLAYCNDLGIEFLSTPYNEEDVDFLVALGVKRLKLASISIAEPHFIRHAAKTGLPLVMSSGMATMGEIEEAVLTARSVGNTDLVMLQCTTNYPSSIDDTNLRAMISIREGLGIRVGYSDHTETDTACIAAVALGAEVIEKHLTLDRTAEGPDHACSCDPGEFASLVRVIREAERCLGSAIKAPTEAERANMTGMRRSLVARRDLKRGEILSESDLTLRRPATGLNPRLVDEIIGRPLRNDIPEGAFLRWEDIGSE